MILGTILKNASAAVSSGYWLGPPLRFGIRSPRLTEPLHMPLHSRKPLSHLVKKEAPGSRFCPHSIFSKSRLSASLPGSLAASDALGLARSGFEATPVVDADHGVSEL
jgi:hypothetical protein